MYGDYLRAILEHDEPISAVRERLSWKVEAAAANNLREIARQAALAEQLLEDLNAPEESARHAFAMQYVAEARTLENDKAEQQRRHESARARLEAEYYNLLNNRLEFERNRRGK